MMEAKLFSPLSSASFFNPQEAPGIASTHGKRVSKSVNRQTHKKAHTNDSLTINVTVHFVITTLVSVSSIALLTGYMVSQGYYNYRMKMIYEGYYQLFKQNERYRNTFYLPSSSPYHHSNIPTVLESPTLHITPEELESMYHDDLETTPYIPQTNADDIDYAAGSGHHLFAKIRNVDPDFATSSKRITSALRRVIRRSQIDPLSIHCNLRRGTVTDDVLGVICIALLKEGSHISVQTWAPGSQNELKDNFVKGSAVTLDFLSSGPMQAKLLEMTLDTIESEFAVPLPKEFLTEEERLSPFHGKPIFRWNQRQRQVQNDPGSAKNPFWEDLGEYLTGVDDIKRKVVSVTSPFQRVDVWEFVDSKRTRQESYLRSLSSDGSYESQHPELFTPEIDVYLDGVLQSNTRGNEAYHEALVQPAMFTHPSPKRVAIIGGGEGATLREVLKHNTLEKVIMIDIDEVMVRESAKHLYPKWNGCDDIIGSTKSCFDDPRADVRFEDALAWFIDRFYDPSEGKEQYDVDEDDEDDENENEDEDENENEDEDEDEDEDESSMLYEEDEFDVIIMDALDPHDNVEFATTLYNNDIFFKSLYKALRDDGLLIAQLGEANSGSDPAEEDTDNANRAAVMRLLKDVGFESVFVYEETHCGFDWPWQFAVACKSHECRSRWLANPAQIDALVHRRLRRSYSGEPLLKNYDGATAAFYQMPTKADETVYCRKNPMPEECALGQGYDVTKAVYGVDSFEIVTGENGIGRVLAKRDIPAFSYIDTGRLIYVHKGAEDAIERTSQLYDSTMSALRPVRNFLHLSSNESTITTEDGLFTPTSMVSLMQYSSNAEGGNVAPLGLHLSQQHPEKVSDAKYRRIYNTASTLVARKLSSVSSGHLLTVKHISKGEELLIASPEIQGSI